MDLFKDWVQPEVKNNSYVSGLKLNNSLRPEEPVNFIFLAALSAHYPNGYIPPEKLSLLTVRGPLRPDRRQENQLVLLRADRLHGLASGTRKVGFAKRNRQLLGATSRTTL